MKKSYIGFITLILGLALTSAGCEGDGTSIHYGETVVHVTADIDTDTTWTGNNLYVLDTNIFVNADLTIEAGTIIKLGTNAGSTITVATTGSITANGTSRAPVTFTSIKDDSAGGDTNEDGTSTAPARGDWYEIIVWGTGNSFNHCRFYYGGNSTYVDAAMVMLCGNSSDRSSAAFNKCTFAHSEQAGLNVLNSLAASTSISGCTFHDNVRPLYMPVTLSIDDSNVFHNGSAGNDFNGIWLRGATFTADVSWGETEVPFVLDNDMVVAESCTLTLQAGVMVKFINDHFDGGPGTIVAAGTSSKHVTFTSYMDDSTGGDTNNDGAATSPAKGDWFTVWAGNGASSFTYCDFYYGGKGTSDETAMMITGTQDADSKSKTIDHCIFAHSANAGLNLKTFPSDSVITNNVFYDCAVPLWMTMDINMPASNTFHNPADVTETNTMNGIWIYNSGVNGTRAWGVTEIPYVCNGVVSINEGRSLTIAAGAILKFVDAGSRFDIYNNATCNYSDVTFTSLKDDARGGDTNGDGSTSSPADGDWHGVNHYYSSAWHDLTDSNMFYDSH